MESLAKTSSEGAGSGDSSVTTRLISAYSSNSRLHRLGHAHSVEVYDGDGALAGGIYGVAIGRMFFGESMFSARNGGSKVALAMLARRLGDWGWPLIDAQVENPHLHSLGGEAWPRPRFLEALAPLVAERGHDGSWEALFGAPAASDLAAAPLR